MILINDHILFKTEFDVYHSFKPSFLQKFINIFWPLPCIIKWKYYRNIKRKDCL